MDNLSKIKKFSKKFHFLLSLLIVVVPLYYILYWALINYLPEQLVTVNIPASPLVAYKLSLKWQIAGFAVSLLPLAACIYGLLNLRTLFSFYKEGIIFSYAHVSIFKSTSKALLLWVFFSMLYESAKSILFSLGAAPGNRVVEVGFSSSELTALMVGGVVLVVAWVMDEGRIMAEENKLTV
jgi:hypothetical protein